VEKLTKAKECYRRNHSIEAHRQNNDGNEVVSAGCTSCNTGFFDLNGQTALHYIPTHSMDRPPLFPHQ